MQEACEAPNINSFQMRSSFGYHENKPGDLLLHDSTPRFIRKELVKKDTNFNLDLKHQAQLMLSFLIILIKHSKEDLVILRRLWNCMVIIIIL